MTSRIAGLVATGMLLTATVASADRAAVIASANQDMAAEAERYNRDTKYTFALEVDWASVTELDKDPSSAKSWAERCGGFMTTLRPLCMSDEVEKAIPACSAYVNQAIKTLRCVVVPDAASERVELKGPTLLYYMASGSDGNAREKVPRTLRTLLPGAWPIKLQHDVDAYLAKQPQFASARMTVDVASFGSGEIESLSGMATYCVPAWDFLEMLNHPECQLKTCKGDFAKKQKFLKGANQLRCVHSKEARAPERKDDALVFYTGHWASQHGSLDGIPFAAYHELRGKLKLRDCGVDDSSTDPRGGGGVMTGWAREQCCPKDKAGKCMKVGYEKSAEVCKVVGFTTEKKCHQRDLLKKEFVDKAR
jgi:hypothetical protein